MSKNPPAFPALREDEYSAHKGMTLLDYFAAKAMEGALSSVRKLTLHDKEVRTCDDIALFAYTQAKAMLKEREKYE